MKSNPSKKVRVFLVDNHPIVRDGIRACLSFKGIVAVVGEAGDEKEALRRLKKAMPDVILLDISLPGLGGVELARRLRQRSPRSKIIAFSMHAGEEYVVRMARSGVHGYVMKDMPTSVLVEAIHRVHEGGLYFPPDMCDAVLSSEDAPRTADEKAPMTPREREVLALLAEGMANKQVARRLGISVRTVETHREHLSRKLGIPSVAGLTKYAVRHGLTSLGASAPIEV